MAAVIACSIYLMIGALVCFLYRTALYKVFPLGKHTTYDVLNDNWEAIFVGAFFPIAAPFAFSLLFARRHHEHPRKRTPREKTSL